MEPIIQINHIAIVVEDIDNALAFWRDSLGLEMAHVENIPEQQARVAFLPVGDSAIELVQPTNGDSGIARFLAKRGPGFHHLCLEVEDIDAALEQLGERGVRLIHAEALTGSGGRRMAFIHPESTQGVLLELYELAKV